MAPSRAGTANYGAGRDRRPPRRDDHRLQGPAEPPGRAGVARSTRPTCCGSPRISSRPRASRATRQHRMQDEVLRGTTVINKGEVLAAAGAEASAAPAAAAAKPAVAMPPKPKGHGEPSGPMSGTKTPCCSASARSCFCWSAVTRRRRSSPLHGVRPGVLRRLHGGVEREARAAHAADERHQRGVQHHRDRRAGADRAGPDRSPRTSRGRTNGYAGSRCAASRSRRSTCSAASPSPGACWRCSANKGQETMTSRLLDGRLPRARTSSRHPLHPVPGGLSNQETSRRGNLYGMIGMAIAVLATCFGTHGEPRHRLHPRRDGGRRGHRPRRAHACR